MSWNLPHSGELRFSFKFDRATASGSGSMENVGGVIGGYASTTTWTNIIPQRAVKLEAIRGGLDVIAERLEGKSTFDLWVRWDSLTSILAAGDRGTDLRSGVIYSLGLPVDPNFRRQWLLIQAVTSGRES